MSMSHALVSLTERVVCSHVRRERHCHGLRVSELSNRRFIHHLKRRLQCCVRRVTLWHYVACARENPRANQRCKESPGAH